MSLTIAQALRKVKKLKGVMAEETARMKAGVSYNKEEVPEFRFVDSAKKRELAQEELIDLESKITFANANNTVVCSLGTVTLSKAVRALQEIKGNITLYKELVLVNKVTKDREEYYSAEHAKYMSEVKEVVMVSDLSEVDRDKKVKELVDAFEVLNNVVEDTNHKVVV